MELLDLDQGELDILAELENDKPRYLRNKSAINEDITRIDSISYTSSTE